MKDLITKLTKIRIFAHDNLVKAKIKSKEYYDKTARPIELKIGDFVFLENDPKPHKFEDRFTGIHKVIEILPNENIRITYKKGTEIIHANRLRLFKGDLLLN